MVSDEIASAHASPALGLDRDVPCPQCRYNLRGLTELRCPECGLHHESWRELQRAIDEKWRRRERHWAIALAVSCGCGALVAVWPLGLLVFAAVCIFAVAAVQAALETVLASLLVGPGGWPRFRAWWEGIVIGYGASALILLGIGHPPYFFERDSLLDLPAAFVWLTVATTLAAVAIQWCVVRCRARHWGIHLPPKRLLPACALAKAITGVLWLFAPLRLVGI
ncbi:MAG TPA: hypothetical protein VGM03_06815 [Phycisphaerae bacterium]|jgi:hypothetical protein